MNSLSYPIERWLRLSILLVVPNLLGCVTSTVQEIRETSTSVSSTDTVVVLGKRDRPSSQETELDFVGGV